MRLGIHYARSARKVCMGKLFMVVLLGLSLSGCAFFEREKDARGNYIAGTAPIEKVAQFARLADVSGYPIGSTVTGLVGIIMGLFYKKKANTSESLARSTMLGVEAFASGPGASVADALKDWIHHDHKTAGVENQAQKIADSFGHSK